MGFGFYAGNSGLYQPTDGNLYVRREPHGMPDFAPLIRYEGSGLRESTATGRNPQITLDDKLPGSLEARRTEAETKKPYLFTKDMTQYLH